MADTEHTEDTEHTTPVDVPTSDLLNNDDLNTPQPARIKGSCSNPNWQPTNYQPYQP